MKKALLFAVAAIFTAVTTASAHPPSDIKITFDPQTHVLHAVIMHNTSNPINHYIKKADIGLNGKEIASVSFTRQENNEYQTVTYSIPDAKNGDVVSVEGYCSISGKLEKKITVQPKP